jgi:hypothetical protein
VQGIAQDGGYWFITQQDRIWRLPMTLELSAARERRPAVRTAPIPEEGIEHLGDCDAHDGSVYVAMEGTDPPRIGVFDLGLEFRFSAPVPGQHSQDAGAANPWCAVNPVDQLLYSSQFNTDRLRAYRPRVTNGSLDLEHVRDVVLTAEDGAPLRLQRVQGGTFTRHGHLYVTSDTREGGLMGFDPASGRRHLHRPMSPRSDAREEDFIEGLTATDLSGGAVPWMRGVLHVLMFDGSVPRPDYVWLRHLDVARERDRRLF